MIKRHKVRDTDLEGKLKKMFPHFFKERFIECSVNDGWAVLVYLLCNMIEAHFDVRNEIGDKNVKKERDEFQIFQIKEKLGELRFYCNSSNEYVSGLVSTIMAISSYTCEFCGTMKDVGKTRDWIKTVCKDCLKEYFTDDTEWKPLEIQKLLSKEE